MGSRAWGASFFATMTVGEALEGSSETREEWLAITIKTATEVGTKAARIASRRRERSGDREKPAGRAPRTGGNRRVPSTDTTERARLDEKKGPPDTEWEGEEFDEETDGLPEREAFGEATAPLGKGREDAGPPAIGYAESGEERESSGEETESPVIGYAESGEERESSGEGIDALAPDRTPGNGDAGAPGIGNRSRSGRAPSSAGFLFSLPSPGAGSLPAGSHTFPEMTSRAGWRGANGAGVGRDAGGRACEDASGDGFDFHRAPREGGVF